MAHDLDDLLGGLVERHNALAGRVDDLEKLELPALLPMTDYSGLVTYTGWSSFTRQMINVTQMGKLTFVQFDISGTSDSTTTEINGVPIAKNTANLFWLVNHRIQDNGVIALGECVIDPNDDRLSWRPSPGGSATGWTASGTKRVVGEIFYVAE